MWIKASKIVWKNTEPMVCRFSQFYIKYVVYEFKWKFLIYGILECFFNSDEHVYTDSGRCEEWFFKKKTWDMMKLYSEHQIMHYWPLSCRYNIFGPVQWQLYCFFFFPSSTVKSYVVTFLFHIKCLSCTRRLLLGNLFIIFFLIYISGNISHKYLI